MSANATTSARHSPLQSLDYSVVQQCMHCGLCLPTCPTYDATRLERNSPRGRIALMRAIADGELEATKTFGEEMYFCLGCLACMTACPAGVNYAELFEHARAEVEQSGALKSPRRDFIRAFALRWLFMDLKRLRLAGRALRLWQQLGLQTLIRRSGVLKLLPKRLRELEAVTPDIQRQFSADLIAPVTPAIGGRKKFRVAMLTGCAQDLVFSDINCDTVEVLRRNGCEVITPSEQHCCGSIFAHNGEWALAQELARKNIAQFPPGQFDAIITNAGGCGSHLKHFSKLLADDPAYRDRAKVWDAKVKDIHEWLVEIGIKRPQPIPSPLNGERGENAAGQSNTVSASIEPSHPSPSIPLPVEGRGKPAIEQRSDLVVTYHESCHLCHGQKITSEPRQLLRAVPNLKLVELPEANWCCGSAGVYNLVQPEMADDLLQRKLAHIQSTGAKIVATGNPGCLLQLINGAKQRGMKLRVVHPVTLLAGAYRREQ